ncbi:restriction endonuclease subunit S [Pseudoalteromonas sp. SG43-1]|uniref:restriction endonuclease subunit S n=1 Tax=Pseudoalteromonas sp. SG43-1 TaxID=2760971 RepID=UPI0016031910|nr:restriction endonuclease subunit S [Pseudoalteromonas sp. SG43-1]MBB1452486.1 restriction endonuclease subunit S [Pseudoalteromonas sp. SG43-1]
MAQQYIEELPKGWVQDELSSICSVISGNAFKSKDFVGSGAPVVKISNVQSGYYLIKNQEYLPFSYLEDTSSSFLVKSEDLLMALTRPITNGKLKICHYPKGSENGLLNQRVCNLKFNAEMDKKYCEYYLLTDIFMKLVESNLSETLQPNLSPKTLSTLPFIVSPLSEQKRIVEKLDSLLAQVDTIQQRLNNLPDIIKRFRQSVLAAAVSGKLTEQWRVDREKENLKMTKIVDLVTFKQGTQVPSPNQIDEAKIGYEKFLRIINFTQRSEDFKFVPVATSNRRIEKKDVVMVRYGATAGYVGTGQSGVLANNLFVMIPKEQLSNEYLFIFLKSPVFQSEISRKVKGGAMPAISFKLFNDIDIQLPSISEQTEIVRLVEQYFALADTLEKNLANAKQRVDNLTQSILAKAFRGELVPQDPNDEPADKLLARIKVARLEAEKLEKAAKKAAKTSKK